MSNNTPAAIVTAIAAAAILGLSAAIDQRSTKKVKTREPLSPKLLADLVRQPLWLIAIGANVVGFILQVVALAFGSLALVQPLLVCDLLFAVLIAWVLRGRANEPQPSAWLTFGGIGVTTVGLVGFLAIGQPTPGHTQARLSMLVPLVVGYVVVVGACLIVANRNRDMQPLALALGCGVSYGVAAFVIKLLTSEFGGGLGAVFANWPIYVFVVVGPAGFILNQNALQQGTLLAPVQAIISVADPILSIALGVAWLDVRLRSSPGAIVGEVVSFLLLTAGIIMTSRAHVADPPAQQ
ncbi:MAG TPA: DMT family transporter, partial [Trebonia sp.]|nr:DMT family transporter [Trebonia sp.]